MHYSNLDLAPSTMLFSTETQDSPRTSMSIRLPRWTQPVLTYITAKPAQGEAAAAKSPLSFVHQALALCLGGSAAAAVALHLPGAHPLIFWPLLMAGLTATTSGLGLFQVVIFHHCAHGTVFRSPKANRTAGRLVSALLLFKHFEHYKREHMQHHSANTLFTDDDEFSGFVVGICALQSGESKNRLWRHLLLSLVSPQFHGRFMYKRLKGSLASHDSWHNIVGISFWISLLTLSLLTHSLSTLLIAWVLPVTVLLQIATVFRILCEHRLPPVEVIERRDQAFVCQATAGVFPGRDLPSPHLNTARRYAAWTRWWADMLTLQLFVRVFVLVGDAPCHDFHHRRPASKRWTDYTHARQEDLDAGCPGFPLNYVDSWGLFSAIDQNFAAMARTPAGLLGAAKPAAKAPAARPQPSAKSPLLQSSLSQSQFPMSRSHGEHLPAVA